MKYPQEKISDPPNAHQKNIQTHKIHTINIFGPTKYPPEKYLDSRNTYERNFCTHEILTSKNFRPTKAQWHDGTRTTEFSTFL